jgi:hypothetical protein
MFATACILWAFAVPIACIAAAGVLLYLAHRYGGDPL